MAFERLWSEERVMDFGKRKPTYKQITVVKRINGQFGEDRREFIRFIIRAIERITRVPSKVKLLHTQIRVELPRIFRAIVGEVLVCGKGESTG